MQEEAATENFLLTAGNFTSVMKDPRFWIEVVLLLLIPYPANLAKKGTVATFTTNAINWVDNSGSFDGHTHEYVVTYMQSDIWTCLTFLRIYFIFEAIFIMLPQSMMSSERMCKEAGFEATFSFKLKAFYKEFPQLFFFTIGLTAVLTFGFIVRVWERPYFEFALSEPFYDFRYLGSSVWYVLMGMTTVGYGNIVASTPKGRLFIMFAILVGSFLLATLVGILLNLKELTSNESDTIGQIEQQLIACRAVKKALKYNVLLQKRIRHLRNE